MEAFGGLGRSRKRSGVVHMSGLMGLFQQIPFMTWSLMQDGRRGVDLDPLHPEVKRRPVAYRITTLAP